MQATVCDPLVARLYEWGVRRTFGYPSDGINGMFGTLRRTGGKIEFVQAQHKEVAVFVASAHARFISELSVCTAAPRPGVAHLITGLYDVWLNCMPVLAITGQRARIVIGGHYQQEADLAAMFRDVADAFAHQASMPTQIRHLLDRMVRITVGQRRVTALVPSDDLQGMPYIESPRVHGTVHSGMGYSAPSVIPQAADPERAVDILNNSRRVAMFVGAGTLGASVKVAAAAEILGVGVVRVLLGKAALPDDLPYVTGTIGLLGTESNQELMNHCDTLLMVGSGLPHTEFLPKESQACGVQIDLNLGTLGLRYPMEVNLVGDSVQMLHAPPPLPQYKTDPY